MRVLVTRPEPGASATLAELQRRGYDATSIPLEKIVALNPASMAEAITVEFDALIITSSNALRHGADVLALQKQLPAFVVGGKTAAALQASGITIAATAETAEALAPIILKSGIKHALYLCGQNRRPDIEAALAAASIKVTIIEVYTPHPIVGAAKALQLYLAEPKPTAILFHAPSAATAFAKLLASDQDISHLKSLCLSPAIANSLPMILRKNAVIAARPSEAELLKLLDGLALT
jgi:uroporphyrinogen-III synthase